MKRVLGLAFALVLVLASPALAHVTVDPSEVAAGGFTKLTFRVPNESDSASTTELEIVFPEAAPFRFVSVKPTPGWTYETAATGDTITGITWSGGDIGPGEFQEFEVSVGPVPEVDVLEFKAIQTYSDGEVARWIDPVVEGEEAEHPAPTATVTHDGEDEGDDEDDGEAAAGEYDADDDGVDGTEPAAFVALLVGGVALVAALAALVMARRRPPT
jgi:uncharacterized protein YcnI